MAAGAPQIPVTRYCIHRPRITTVPNSRDQVLPPSLFGKCKFISVGATGWVFEVAPGIALKYLCTDRDEEFRREHEMYELMERNSSSQPPHFIQSFLRLPDAHFMQRMATCLDSRLESNHSGSAHDPTYLRFSDCCCRWRQSGKSTPVHREQSLRIQRRHG